MTHRLFLLLVLVLSLLLVGCRQSSEPVTNPNVQISVRYEPDPPTAGEGVIVVIVQDANGNPIDDASVSVRGDMNHAGMTPVLRDVSEKGEGGEYRADFNWSMGGDWILTITATLNDGSTTEAQFNVRVGA